MKVGKKASRLAHDMATSWGPTRERRLARREMKRRLSKMARHEGKVTLRADAPRDEGEAWA